MTFHLLNSGAMFFLNLYTFLPGTNLLITHYITVLRISLVTQLLSRIHLQLTYPQVHQKIPLFRQLIIFFINQLMFFNIYVHSVFWHHFIWLIISGELFYNLYLSYECAILLYFIRKIFFYFIKSKICYKRNCFYSNLW